jgi:hypothetical protein
MPRLMVCVEIHVGLTAKRSVNIIIKAACLG